MVMPYRHLSKTNIEEMELVKKDLFIVVHLIFKVHKITC